MNSCWTPVRGDLFGFPSLTYTRSSYHWDGNHAVTSGVGSQHQQILNLGKSCHGSHCNQSMEATSPQKDRWGTIILLQRNNDSKAIKCCLQRQANWGMMTANSRTCTSHIHRGRQGCGWNYIAWNSAWDTEVINSFADMLSLLLSLFSSTCLCEFERWLHSSSL